MVGGLCVVANDTAPLVRKERVSQGIRRTFGIPLVQITAPTAEKEWKVNDMRLIEVVVRLLVFVTIWFLISLCWVGAEVVFEGCVHSSGVDGFISSMLALYIFRDIIRAEGR